MYTISLFAHNTPIMINMTTIGKMIKERTEKLGLTDAEVARRADIEYRKYSYYATGQRTPPYEALGKISEVLGMTPNDFFSISSDALDSKSLETAVVELEKWLSLKKKQLTPTSKALAIRVLYEHIIDNKGVDSTAMDKEIALVISAINE